MDGKPKTVFERLEERMEELEVKIDQIRPEILNKILPILENLKNDISGAVGPSLMNFADMIGEQIENVSKSVSSSTSSSDGSSISASGELAQLLTQLQQNMNQIQANLVQLNAKTDVINAEMNNLKSAISQMKTSGQKIKETPAVSQVPTQQVQPTIQPQIKPTAVVPSQKAQVEKTQPTPAVSTSIPIQTPTYTTEASTVPPEVFKLFDSLLEKVKANTLALQMADYMDEVRDKIVSMYKWHPTLYELSSIARKLKKFTPDDPIDSESYQLILEKVQEWKTRIKTG